MRLEHMYRDIFEQREKNFSSLIYRVKMKIFKEKKCSGNTRGSSESSINSFF